MRLLLSAGEASGDAYGAALLREIRRLSSDLVVCQAVGGAKIAAEGAALIADSSGWGSISAVEALKIVPQALRGLHAAKQALREGERGLFVPIDFGFFNVRLAREAKRQGWKVLYWMPPGSWKRGPQGRDLAEVTDAVATPFEWSEAHLKEAGVNAFWFGHPLLQMRAQGKPSAQGQRLAVLPGSRRHELALNLPLLAETLSGHPGPVEFAVAPSVNLAWLEREWSRLAPQREWDLLTQGAAGEVLARSRGALVCSGTATLEAALCRCPMVVFYKVGKLVEMEAKLVGFKARWIALPNILLERDAVPELVQSAATPERMRAELCPLLEDGPAREGQLAAFEEIRRLLGGERAVTQTAELALSLAGAQK